MEEIEHSYQKTDSRLEVNEDERGFKLFELIHINDLERIQNMGITEVSKILISLRSLKAMDAQMLSGPRANENMLVVHLRDFLAKIQSPGDMPWQKSFLSLLLACGFTSTEIDASLNSHFMWEPQTRSEFDSAARQLGMSPIFSDSTKFDATE